MEVEMITKERQAAWEMSVVLMTSGMLQPAPVGLGTVFSRLDVLGRVMTTYESILQEKGEVALVSIAMPVLNQIIRPFYEEWCAVAVHSPTPRVRTDFRTAFEGLQVDLRNFNRMLLTVACLPERAEELTVLASIGGEAA